MCELKRSTNAQQKSTQFFESNTIKKGQIIVFLVNDLNPKKKKNYSHFRILIPMYQP